MNILLILMISSSFGNHLLVFHLLFLEDNCLFLLDFLALFLLSRLFFLFLQEFAHLFPLFHLHLFHFAPNVIPIVSNSSLDKGDEVFLCDSVPFSPEKLQKVNNVVCSGFFKNQSFQLLLFLCHLFSGVHSNFFITFGFDFLQLLTKPFFLFIQKINDFGLNQSLMAFFRCGLSDQIE